MCTPANLSGRQILVRHKCSSDRIEVERSRGVKNLLSGQPEHPWSRLCCPGVRGSVYEASQHEVKADCEWNAGK